MIQVAEALANALTAGHTTAEPLPVTAGPSGSFGFLDELRARSPDLVINLCESLAADSRGEMAVPALLDVLGVSYTGSSALSLGLALHKDKAKELLRARNVATPEFHVVSKLEDVVTVELPFPLIVKPAREDASVGVDFDSVVHDRKALGKACGWVLRNLHQPALVERFVEGREIYVPILGNSPRRALPLSEIHFGKAFEGRPNIVSYRAKWELDSPECIDSPSGPCTLDEVTQERVVRTALAAFDALDCRDYGRVDLRLSSSGEPYVIDINPNCDLHPEAGFARSAAAAGIDFAALAQRLVEISLERSHGNSTDRAAAQGQPRRAAGTNRNLLAGRSGLRHRAHRPLASG
ncbi:MAG: ATP-grasp domain-containing protein [Myxococcaceae bacterium]